MSNDEKVLDAMGLGCLLFSAPFFIVCIVLAILAFIDRLT